MILAAYLVTCFLVASVYAVGMLRGRRDRHHRLGLLIPLTVGCILAPIQFMVGDTAARAIAEDQPIKFAAMECVQHTHRDVNGVHRRTSAPTTGSSGGSGSRASTRSWSASAPTPRSPASTRCHRRTARRRTRPAPGLRRDGRNRIGDDRARRLVRDSSWWRNGTSRGRPGSCAPWRSRASPRSSRWRPAGS